MVANVDEILQIVRSNPFIDGIGYFIEVTTIRSVPAKAAQAMTERMQEEFCLHAQVTQEGDNIVGFDFHEHIFTQGDDSERTMASLQRLLAHVEQEFGIDHLCIEFQFDMKRARRARLEVDDLLRP